MACIEKKAQTRRSPLGLRRSRKKYWSDWKAALLLKAVLLLQLMTREVHPINLAGQLTKYNVNDAHACFWILDGMQDTYQTGYDGAEWGEEWGLPVPGKQC